MRHKPLRKFKRMNILKTLTVFLISTFFTKTLATSNLQSFNFSANKKSIDGIRIFETQNLPGALGTSLAGGCDLQILGDPFNQDVYNLQFVFNNSLYGIAQSGPSMNQYNEYNSNPSEGRIQYTTPEVTELTGLSEEDFKEIKQLSLSLSILDTTLNTQKPRYSVIFYKFSTQTFYNENPFSVNQYQCNIAQLCLIKYSLDYTPILYYMTPRVAFDGSEVAFIIDPKSTQSLKSSNELFFKHALIDQNTIDFNEFVQTYTLLNPNTKGQVRGRVNQAQPNHNSKVQFKFKAGYAIHDLVTSLQCSFNNQTCYEAQIVPSINSINKTQGDILGNDLLEINGHGLQTFKDSHTRKSIQISIDGVPCQIVSNSNTQVRCLTGPNPVPSNESWYVGSNGVRRDFFTSTYPLTWQYIGQALPTKSSLITTLELSQNQLKSYSGNKLSGYFRPPATGNYRFYMSCDDTCQLYLSNVTMDQTQKNLILTVGGATSYRGYFTPTNSRVSAWQQLNGGEYYYYEVHHIQHTGNDHLTVSVEIENNHLPGHHQSSKEIQRLQINPQITREQFKIIVNNPDGQYYNLRLFKGTTPYNYNISTNATSSQLQQAIQPFFTSYCCAYSVPISVNRTMFDIDGNQVTNQNLSVRNEYTITVNRAIAQPSFTFGGALNQSTGQPISSSKITLMPPSQIQLSSTPLSGSFRITCQMRNGQLNQTEDLLYNASISKIKSAIVQACTQYLDRIDVSDGNLYNFYQDGRDIIIRFSGVNYDPDQLIIESSLISPLSGGNSSIDIKSITEELYGQHLMWEPVPFEWLYTAETKPQVKCVLEGLPCVCSSLSCSFEYIDTSLLSPQGNGRRLESSQISSILQKMKEPKRQLQYVTTTRPFFIIGFTVSPSEWLNPLGGQLINLTIPNWVFPNPSSSTASITIDGTECLLISYSITLIQCQTPQLQDEPLYDPNALEFKDIIVTINIKSAEYGNVFGSQGRTYGLFIPQIQHLGQTLFSPVEKSYFTIQIDQSSFIHWQDQGYEKEDYEVRFFNTTTGVDKRFYVVNTNSQLSQIVVKYTGIQSGYYNISVRNSFSGYLNTSAFQIQVAAKITSFSPSQVSIKGGALITINGYKFSSTINYDSPIRLGTTPCFIVSSQVDQIKCRLEPRRGTQTQEDLILYLSTLQQAECDTLTKQCQITWISDTNQLPLVTGQIISIDPLHRRPKLLLTGERLGSEPVQLFIDGSLQDSALPLNGQSVEFKLKNDLQSKFLDRSKIQIFMDKGVPEGLDRVFNNGLSLESMSDYLHPISITPHEGSPAGSIIFVNVVGYTSDVQGFNLVHNGQELCEWVEYIELGKLKCKTKPGNRTLANLTTTFINNGVRQNKVCNPNVFSCDMEYYTNFTKFPRLTTPFLFYDFKIINSELTPIVYEVLELKYTFHASYCGVEADLSDFGGDAVNITVNDTTLILTNITSICWENRLPYDCPQNPKFLVYFKKSEDYSIHYIDYLEFTNPQGQFSMPADYTAILYFCSFLGGCEIRLGLPIFNSLQNNQSFISVCGQPAKIIQHKSDATFTVFEVPPVFNIYSYTNFKLPQQFIDGMHFSSVTNQQITNAPFDGDIRNGFVSTQASCYFEVHFKQGYVGYITKIQYFINTNKKIKNTLIQGWDAVNQQWVLIHSIDTQPKEGWNYIDLRQNPAIFNIIRVSSSTVGGCDIGEIKFWGAEVLNDLNQTMICPVEVTIWGKKHLTKDNITLTQIELIVPTLLSIYPEYGSVRGGELVSFYMQGVYIPTIPMPYTILIDGVKCNNVSIVVLPAEDLFDYDVFNISCITGPKTQNTPTSLVINIDNQGYVLTQGAVYNYVSEWSDPATWGDDYLPTTGDSIHIQKGVNVLFDLVSSPVLNTVVIEGSLIFKHDQNIDEVTFDAHNVIVRGGKLQIGTEQNPYMKKLNITLHGKKEDPQLPLFGNKVIAVIDGTIDIHGQPVKAWSFTQYELYPGDNEINSTDCTYLRDIQNIRIGDSFLLAPTNDFSQAEQVFYSLYNITQDENTDPVTNITVENCTVRLTFQPRLSYQHSSFTDKGVQMKTEYGLLSRNILIQGDFYSIFTDYGPQIVIYSTGSSNSVARLEHFAIKNGGQGSKLGRHPIHFHKAKDQFDSYVRNVTIQNSYNKGIVLKETNYLRVQDNFVYNSQGHAIFLETGTETKNIIENNAVIRVNPSYHSLVSDQTPAAFMITNPDNYLIGNSAVGSQAYGFWYHLLPYSTGSSYDPQINPQNTQLGQFMNNIAHTNVKDGLRIGQLTPRTYPNGELASDPNNSSDPYWRNPLVTATFENFTSWKNKENGVYANTIGDVRFNQIKLADNLKDGFEVSLVKDAPLGTAQISNSTILGLTKNSDFQYNNSIHAGIVTPRSENFYINNVNYENMESVFPPRHIKTCSQCENPFTTDHGARTVKVENLKQNGLHLLLQNFNPMYGYPQNDALYYIQNGIGQYHLSFNQRNYHNFNLLPGQLNIVNQGVFFDQQVQLKRVFFFGYQPSHFDGADMRITEYDQLQRNKNQNHTQNNTNVDENENIDIDIDFFDYQDQVVTQFFSKIPFKQGQLGSTQSNGWAAMMKTNHTYQVHWKEGLDFTQMRIEVSEKWDAQDQNIILIFNFTEDRAQIAVTINGELIPNGTLVTKAPQDLQSGDNVLYNDTNTKQFHLLINGKNATRKVIVLTGRRCIGVCPGGGSQNNYTNQTGGGDGSGGNGEEDNTDNVPKIQCRWSDPESWPSGHVPLRDESVEVPYQCDMLFDVAETPILNVLTINGKLTFEDTADRHLRAKIIQIVHGELNIGTAENPFTHQANITLYGEKSSQYIMTNEAIEVGNKLLVNTNKLSIYGMPRNRLTRLKQNLNSLVAFVDPQLDWQLNDQVAIIVSGVKYNTSYSNMVNGYSSETGQLDLVWDWPSNSDTYYGNLTSTEQVYGVDIRTEVALLTRNVVIQADLSQNDWGCQVLTSTYQNLLTGSIRSGQTILSNVEIRGCSQKDTEKSALRFDSVRGGTSIIKECTIHRGQGIGVSIVNSANIQLKDNVIFDHYQFGVNIAKNSQTIVLEGNLVAHIKFNQPKTGDSFLGQTAGIVVCARQTGDICSNILLKNNVVAGTQFAGFITYLHACGQYSQSMFVNNIAHSINGVGAILYPSANEDINTFCGEGSYFTAYKNLEDGALSYFKLREIRFSHMLMIDNVGGPTANIGRESLTTDDLEARLHNITLWGATELDEDICQVDLYFCFYNPNNYWCKDKVGLFLPQFTKEGKDIMPNTQTQLPMRAVYSDAAWSGKINITDLKIYNFSEAASPCGYRRIAISLNPNASDYQVPVEITNIYADNLEERNFFKFRIDEKDWPTIDKCGERKCSGPGNVLIRFKNAQLNFKNNIMPNTIFGRQEFQFHSRTLMFGSESEASGFYLKNLWSNFPDENYQKALLLFESLDSDNRTRLVDPIYLQSLGYQNMLMSFMNHQQEKFPYRILRTQRFPGIIQVGSNVNTTIQYTGTAPKNQRFTLRLSNYGTVLRIKYDEANAYEVKKATPQGLVEIESNVWNDNLRAFNPIQRSRCGENRYIGVENVLEFYLTPDCTLHVSPINAVMGTLRLQWTLDEFYADGGSESFIFRVASALGIDSANIKVAAVYKGSVIVEFMIIDAIGELSKSGDLQNVKRRLVELIANRTLNVGATILDAQVSISNVSSTSTSEDYKEEPSISVSTTASGTKITTQNSKVNIVTGASSTKQSEQIQDEDQRKYMIAAIILGVIALLIGAIIAGVIGYRRYLRTKEQKVNPEKYKSYSYQTERNLVDSARSAIQDAKQEKVLKIKQQAVENIVVADINDDGDVEEVKVEQVNEVTSQIEARDNDLRASVTHQFSSRMSFQESARLADDIQQAQQQEPVNASGIRKISYFLGQRLQKRQWR